MSNKVTVLPFIAISVIFPLSVSAQSNKKPTPMAQVAVEKSGSIYGGATVKGADVEFDGDLRLSLKGNTIIGGSLDACTATDSSSSVSDRFKVQLSSKGNDLTGSGSTDYGNQPVSINLKKGGSGDSITLTGQVVVGGVSIDIKTDDVDLQKVEESTEEPDDNQETVQVPTFNVIQIKAPIGKVKNVVGALRSEPVTLSSGGLIPSCVDMRNGYVNLEATTNPSRVQGTISSLSSLSGVEAKISSITDPNMTVRIEKNKPGSSQNDSEIADKVSQAVRSVIGGTGESPATSNPATGEYGITVLRDSALSKRIGLKEALTTKFVIGRDTKDQATYINFMGTTAKLVDEQSSKKMVLSDDLGASEEGGSQTGVNTTYLDNRILENVANKVGGQTWDGENGKWK